MKVCFLLSYSPNPRMKKRIGLIKSRYDTSLIYWKRTEKNIWGRAEGDIKTVEISTSANNGNPLARIIPTCKFAIKALKNLRKIKPKCIYVENLDMLIVASLHNIWQKNKTKIVYEIADIHSLLIDQQKSIIKKIIQKVLKHVDAKLCKKIGLLVNTSEKFYDMYYSDFVPKEKLLVIPNIPEKEVFENYNKKTGGEFTVGFIGAIRYKEQMKMLIRATEQINVKVLFAGAGIDDEIEKMCQAYKHVRYYGEYDYKTEISKLYGSVDCIYSVYDADISNVRIALPNKLYEAIFCEIPIIVAKNTYLSDLVNEMGVGVSISHNNERELKEVLNKLAKDEEFYDSIVEVCSKHKEYLDNSKHNKRLLNIIESMVSS